MLGYPWVLTVHPCLQIYYEYNYMKKLIKNNFLQARRFNNTVRYIDDLLTLNNPGFSDEI